MSLPKAFIFDLDGVIVDTVDAHFTAWKTIANELGVDFNEEENEHLKGVSRIDSMKRILAMGNIEKTATEVQALTERKNVLYLEAISQMTPADILPGVLELIDLLKQNNIAIAIGSSSKNTPTILRSVQLDRTFSVVIDGNQTTRSKPAPEVFLKGAAQLNVEPHECVVIEDATSGVEAAKAGGFICIGVGDAQTLRDADVVVADLTAIDLPFLHRL